MTIVTEAHTPNNELHVTFDNEMGWYIEGYVPSVPEDGNVRGWVCFDLELPYTKVQVKGHLLILGMAEDVVDKLLEDF